MLLIHAFLSGSMESIGLSHGAGGLHTLLPFHTTSTLADSLLLALDPLLYYLPRKFWTFSFMLRGTGLSPGFQDLS